MNKNGIRCCVRSIFGIDSKNGLGKFKQIQKFKPAVSLPKIQTWSWSPWRCSRGCTSQGRWTPPSKWPGKAKDDIWWKWQKSFVKVVASFQVIRFPATYLVATFMSGNLTNIQDFWEGQGWDFVKVILWKWKWSPPTKWPRKIRWHFTQFQK